MDLYNFKLSVVDKIKMYYNLTGDLGCEEYDIAARLGFSDSDVPLLNEHRQVAIPDCVSQVASSHSEAIPSDLRTFFALLELAKFKGFEKWFRACVGSGLPLSPDVIGTGYKLLTAEEKTSDQVRQVQTPKESPRQNLTKAPGRRTGVKNRQTHHERKTGIESQQIIDYLKTNLVLNVKTGAVCKVTGIQVKNSLSDKEARIWSLDDISF